MGSWFVDDMKEEDGAFADGEEEADRKGTPAQKKKTGLAV